MKFIKFFYVAIALSMFSVSYAQPKIKKPDNIVFLVRQKEHIMQGLKTIQSLRQSKISTIKPGAVAIIVCGEAVKDLIKEDIKELLQNAETSGVILYACGLSLSKFGIEKQQLPSSILYVENGLIKILELQKSGYLSVEL